MGVKDLPLDSGKKITKVFESLGWVSHRGGRNHFVLTHPNKAPTLVISIPDHRHVDRALLKTELRKAGISEEEFCKIYNGR
jgi:predicted RNA binding protein YcfA (HicA-like mRNA interferase family)